MLTWARTGHGVHKPPFQGQLAFSCEDCLPSLPDAPPAHVTGQAKPFPSTAGTSIWLRPRVLRAGILAIVHPDRCLSLPSVKAPRRSSSSVWQPLAITLSGSVSVGLTINPENGRIRSTLSGSQDHQRLFLAESCPGGDALPCKNPLEAPTPSLPLAPVPECWPLRTRRELGGHRSTPLPCGSGLMRAGQPPGTCKETDL